MNREQELEKALRALLRYIRRDIAVGQPYRWSPMDVPEYREAVKLLPEYGE